MMRLLPGGKIENGGSMNERSGREYIILIIINEAFPSPSFSIVETPSSAKLVALSRAYSGGKLSFGSLSDLPEGTKRSLN